MRAAWRNFLLGALIAGQAAGIVAGRFGTERYFCWAPYDEITQFEVAVAIADRRLSASEAQARYRLPDGGRDNRSHAHVIATIAHYERTLGAADAAQVELTYRINGGTPRQWRWPRVAGTGGT